METVAGHIKSAIAARSSPESKHSRDDTMVANNKHGDGRGEREDQNSDSQQVGDENLVVKEPAASHGCKVNFLTSKTKRELACMLCWKKFCSACSKLQKKKLWSQEFYAGLMLCGHVSAAWIWSKVTRAKSGSTVMRWTMRKRQPAARLTLISGWGNWKSR